MNTKSACTEVNVGFQKSRRIPVSFSRSTVVEKDGKISIEFLNPKLLATSLEDIFEAFEFQNEKFNLYKDS